MNHESLIRTWISSNIQTCFELLKIFHNQDQAVVWSYRNEEFWELIIDSLEYCVLTLASSILNNSRKNSWHNLLFMSRFIILTLPIHVYNYFKFNEPLANIYRYVLLNFYFKMMPFIRFFSIGLHGYMKYITYYRNTYFCWRSVYTKFTINHIALFCFFYLNFPVKWNFHIVNFKL